MAEAVSAAPRLRSERERETTPLKEWSLSKYLQLSVNSSSVIFSSHQGERVAAVHCTLEGCTALPAMAEVTLEDKQNIKVIWDQVYPSAEETGQVIVIRLFVDFPKTKNYFKKLKDVSTMEEMQASALIKAHGMRVMNAINQIIENMDNWNEVCNIVARLAKRHQDAHQVEVYNFMFLFEVIMNVLTEALGCAFTQDIKASWKKLFSVLYDYISRCYTVSSLMPEASGITV